MKKFLLTLAMSPAARLIAKQVADMAIELLAQAMLIVILEGGSRIKTKMIDGKEHLQIEQKETECSTLV
jgi:hypothetical protein